MDELIVKVYELCGAPLQVTLLGWVVFELRKLRRDTHRRLTKLEVLSSLKTAEESSDA